MVNQGASLLNLGVLGKETHYLLCAEGLLALLRKDVETRVLHGVLSSQHGVCISHLLFADDSLLFCKATVGECQQLLHILGQYEEASGQAINRQRQHCFLVRIQSRKLEH